MKKGRDLSFFEGKINVKDLCREQMRILKKFNFRPPKTQQNKNRTTRMALNKRNKIKEALQIKNEIEEESPKPQPFTPPIPMSYPKRLEHIENQNNNEMKDSKNKCKLSCSESPISSIYTDSGQISDLSNILQPKLKVVEYPITSLIETKLVDKTPSNNNHNPLIIEKKVAKNKNSKYDIKLSKSKPLIVNYSSSTTSTSIPTTLTSSSTVNNYNDNIFPSSDSSPPFTPLPAKPQLKQQRQIEEEKQKIQEEEKTSEKHHHLSKSNPTSISIPSTLTVPKSSATSTTISSLTSTFSSNVFNKRKINTASSSSSTIPSELGSSVGININQKIGVNTPPPPPELLINRDLLLPRRLRQIISPVIEDSESSSNSNINISIKNEEKSQSLSLSSSSFHPSFLSKTIKPSYSPVSSPNRKRNHKVIIKQSPLSSPYKHLKSKTHNQSQIQLDSISSSSSCSLILDNNIKSNKLNLKIPNDNVSDILVKDIKYIIDSSRKSIESMKEEISLKTIKEENTEDERSSVNIKQNNNSMIMNNNIVKRIDFETSESEEEEKEVNEDDEEDSDEEEIIGDYSSKSSNKIKEENQEKKSIEKIEKEKEEKEIKDDISLSHLTLPLPTFPIFDEADSQSDDTNSTTSSSTMISNLLNYSPKYMTRDEIENKYNKVCFKYPPLFLDSDFVDL